MSRVRFLGTGTRSTAAEKAKQQQTLGNNSNNNFNHQSGNYSDDEQDLPLNSRSAFTPTNTDEDHNDDNTNNTTSSTRKTNVNDNNNNSNNNNNNKLAKFSDDDDDNNNNTNRVDDNDDSPVLLGQTTETARLPAVLEPSGRSALEQFGADAYKKDLYLSMVAKTWPLWRRRVSRFVRFHAVFEWTVFFLIVLNALVIILDSVVEGSIADGRSSGLSTLQGWVSGVDNFVTWAFVLEMLLKWVAMGFWTKGSGYFGNFGNCVDFFINCFSVFAVVFEAVSPGSVGAAGAAVRSVRLLRTFRAVKALRGLSVLVDALFVAIRRLVDVGLLYVLFITFMCFIGLQLFRKSYSRKCVFAINATEELPNLFNDTIPVGVVHTSVGYMNSTVYWRTGQQVCERGMPIEIAEKIAALTLDEHYNHVADTSWSFPDINNLLDGYVCPYGQFCMEGLQSRERGMINFDSVFYAMTTLVTVSVFEQWDVIMYDAMYARGQAASWYFLVVALAGSIFTMNLILAILTDAFTQSLSILRRSLDELDHNNNDNQDDENTTAEPLVKNQKKGSKDLVEEFAADEVIPENFEQPEEQQEIGEISRSRYKKFDHQNVWEAKDNSFGVSTQRNFALSSAAAGGDGRGRSFSVIKELRTKVHTTDLALDNSSHHHIKMMSDAEIDSSLDWLRNEWAVVVLEARQREDLQLTAAEMLHDADFRGLSGCKSKFYGIFRRFQSWILQNIVAARWFMYLGFVLTIVNVFVLSIIFAKMPQSLRDTLNTISIILSMCFVVESVLRILGLGLRTFFRDPFNVIDGLLAIVSIVELVISGKSAVSAVRTIRLLRLLSFIPSIINTLRTLAVALKAAASLMVQLSIMMFVMAVLGQQLFRGKLCGLDEDPSFLVVKSNLCDSSRDNDNGLAPAFNFDNLASSLVVVFVVVAGDGWRQYWIDCSARTSPYHALYFIAIYLMGNYIFVNLFVAVLIDAANQSRAAAEEEEKALKMEDPSSDDELKNVSTSKARRGENDDSNNNDNNAHELSAPLAGATLCVVSEDEPRREVNNNSTNNSNDSGKNSLNQETSDQSETNKKFDAQFDDAAEESKLMQILYAPVNWLYAWHARTVSQRVRIACAKFASNKLWRYFLTTCSVTSSVSYLFWAKATDHPYSYRSQTLNWLELIVSVVSTIDATSRFFALGRVCSPLTYFVNIFSYVVVGLQWSTVPNRSQAVALLRVVTRSIRPWTFLMRFGRIRLIFYSLTRAVRALRSVGVIALLLWFTYGVLGAQLFSGKFAACTDSPLEKNWGDQTYGGNKITNETECVSRGYEWVSYKYNYDNVGNAMKTLVTAATTDDWSNTMYLTTGITTDTPEGIAPEPGKLLINTLFMITFCALFSFFLINVIVSVIVDAFFTTKKQMEEKAAEMSDIKQREVALQSIAGSDGSSAKSHRISLACTGELDVLTDTQQDYYDLVLHALLLVKPTMPVNFGPGSCRWKVRSIIRSAFFNYVYLLVVLLDFAIQASSFVESPPISSWALVNIDFTFSVILICFTLCRILGNSIRGFAQDFSNLFELSVNVMILCSCLCSIIIFATGKLAHVDSTSPPINHLFRRFEQNNFAGVVFGMLRNLRILRFQRILNTFHGVRVIIFTIRNSVNNFVAGITVVFLVYFFFSCLGLALFGRVAFNGSGLTPNDNFNTLPMAFITLFRVGTEDDWEAVMRSTGIDTSPCDPNIGDCGRLWISVPFFYAFMCFGQWVTMSSFVAILLNSFAQADRRERFSVQKKDVDRFRKLWKMFADPKTQLMKVGTVPLFIQRVGPVFAIEDEQFIAMEAMNILRREQARKERRLAAAGGGGANALSFSSFTMANFLGSSSAATTTGMSSSHSSENESKKRANTMFLIDPAMAESAIKMNSKSSNEKTSSSQSQTPADNNNSNNTTDVDDSAAGNDFDHASFLKMAVNKNSLRTKFCSMKQSYEFVKELDLTAVDSGSFQGAVTQCQVFEACLKHHYGVRIPIAYEEDLSKTYETTFPLDISRTQAAEQQLQQTTSTFSSPLRQNNSNNNNASPSSNHDSALTSPTMKSSPQNNNNNINAANVLSRTSSVRKDPFEALPPSSVATVVTPETSKNNSDNNTENKNTLFTPRTSNNNNNNNGNTKPGDEGHSFLSRRDSSSVSNDAISNSKTSREKSGAQNNHRGFNASSANDLLGLIKIQAWWRGMKFQRVVQQLMKKQHEERGSNQEEM